MKEKIEILEEFLNIGGNVGFGAHSEIKEKIQNYLKTTVDDQLEDVLRIIELYETELEYNHDFEKSHMILAPVFERLKDEGTWDIYDMRLIASVVKHAESCKKSCELGEIIIKKAEEFENQGKGDFLRTKFAAYANITGRLLDEKYEKIEDWSAQEVEELFFKYSALAVKFANQLGFSGALEFLEVRKGLFLNNFDIVENNLAALESLENKWLHKHASDEVNLYKSYIRFPIGKKEFATKVGKRIKKERQRLDLSREKVAEYLRITDTQVRFIENGTRGITSFNLYRFAKLFDVTVDYFLDAADELEPGEERKVGVREREMKEWVSLADDLTVKEAIFITKTIKNLKEARKK